MSDTNVLFISYIIAVIALLTQYAALSGNYAPSMFFNTQTQKNNKKTQPSYPYAVWGALAAFITNLTAISITFAHKSTQENSERKINIVLALQIFYYVSQWMYVPFLMLIQLQENNNVRIMVQIGLAAGAVVHIIAFTVLFDVPFTTTNGTQTAAIVMQGFTVAWVTLYDAFFYSFWCLPKTKKKKKIRSLQATIFPHYQPISSCKNTPPQKKKNKNKKKIIKK